MLLAVSLKAGEKVVNSVFEKNIDALKIKNPILAQNLQTYIPDEIPQIVQSNGAYNLIYRGKYLHSEINPLAEAIEIFSLTENTPVAIHLIYGLGLGYLFQVASAQSEGTVILYEPDLNILKIVFTLVDFSNDFLKKNIYIANNFDEVSEYIYKKSGTENSPQMISLPTQTETEGFKELVKKLQALVGSFSLDLKYTKQKFYPSLKMLIQNIPSLLEEIPLIKFKDIYKGKTALVVSAGPTLDRNIETIKKYRDKFILFVVGTALKTLVQNGIKPDFVSIIETYDSSKQLSGIDLSDTYFITEPYSNPNLRKFKFKQRFSHISSNMPVNHFWAKVSGENIEEYFSRGTVSYTVLNSARILGFKKIILVGQDLAYIEGQCYSKDSAYKNLVCGINPENGRWEIMANDFDEFANAISNSPNAETRMAAARRRLQNLNSSLFLVKGIQGDMIPTESVYAAFIRPLNEFAEHFNDREYINTSLVGAQIDGFKNIPLKEALNNSEQTGNIELKCDFKYDIENIKSNILKELELLKEALNLIREGKSIDLSQYRVVDSNMLKALKKLSLIYLNLSSDFANKSMLFDFITTADKIDLDYEMKMTKEFTVESIRNIASKIQKYLDNASNKIIEIERLVNESFNTKG